MKRAQPTFVDKVVRIIALLMAISLLLGFIAGNVDPRENRLIPFFGLAYPFLLVLNVFMIVWWCIRRRWRFAMFTLLLIALGWRAFTATFSFSGEQGMGPKADPSLIRMMTYNVHSFRPYDDKNLGDVKSEMLKLIETENPDIICLQEYYTRKKGSYNLTDSLKRILKTSNYYFRPSSKNDYEATGLAIFSKYPIKNKGNIVFDVNKGGNESIYVDIEVNKKQVRIYNVHLQSISFNKQDYRYLDKITKKMDPELLPSKRILSMLNSAFLKRSGQVDLMKAHMKTCEIPFLIAGDFNDTPASYAVTQLTNAMNNSFIKMGSGLGRTYNGKFPNFQIDYIATTKEFEIINQHIIEAKLSDHFPVRSDLKLNPTPL
ncbi:endonuclease/exonuclease/phosphatase family metal-dependent hydrolase [Pedobacter sp. CG_S7]|uniref:endonuclease/exonuclease/phosphatase family protein n=1 Tax=Pedobacter sp. CG_S7 TaxID=3143930 RepID=UPI00339487E7